MRFAALLICVMIPLSACASASGARTTAGARAPESGSTTDSSTNQGSATDLLAEVPGCEGVTALSVEAAAAEVAVPGARDSLRRSSTAASCSLRGHSVVLFAFADPGDLALARRAVNGARTYLGAGRGWLVLPLSIDVPVIQLSAVQGVAEPLHGTVSRGGS